MGVWGLNPNANLNGIEYVEVERLRDAALQAAVDVVRVRALSRSTTMVQAQENIFDAAVMELSLVWKDPAPNATNNPERKSQ